MPRNVEIKARVENLAVLTKRATALADSGPTELAQDDTFFPCPNGRLKLRQFADGAGELIFYRRTDHEGPTPSFYVIARTRDPEALRTVLTHAYGQSDRVVKQRTLYIAGRTRIHLDRVVGLGDFLELEVVLEDAEADEVGVRTAQELMQRLDVAPSQLVKGAYVDLLQHGATRS